MIFPSSKSIRMEWGCKLLKNKISILFLNLILIATGAIAVPASWASTNEECPFGQKYIEGDYDVDSDSWSSSCEPMSWEYTNENDGFSKKVLISMDEDLYGLPGSTTVSELTLIVRCENKKLEVFFASNYILFNNQNRSYSKKLQYKIDNGKINTTTFGESTSDKAFFVNTPQTFLKNAFKGKNKISIKFASSKGNQVSQFPISDLSYYRSKLNAAGCKF